MPVPYNLGFSLSILTQYNEDAMQIIEQILPIFQPSFNVTVDLVESIGEKRDVPLVLENINFEDNYSSGYEEKRVIVHNLQFTAKTYIFGAIADNSEGLIRKVQVDYHTTTNTKTAKRELRYVATPRALKDYNDDNATTLAQDIDAEQTQFLVTNASSLVVDGYIYIGKELLDLQMTTNCFNDDPWGGPITDVQAYWENPYAPKYCPTCDGTPIGPNLDGSTM